MKTVRCPHAVSDSLTLVAVLAIALAGVSSLACHSAGGAPAVTAPAGSPSAATPAMAPSTAASARPDAASQVTFLYFKDLPAAAAFYRDTLGLTETFVRDFVHIIQLSPTSFVGLVDATHGSHKPADDKPVMVSLVVPRAGDVDAWHAFLKSRGVTIRHAPEDVAKVGIRAMGFADPEGHTLEVFAWTGDPAAP